MDEKELEQAEERADVPEPAPSEAQPPPQQEVHAVIR